MGTPWDLGRQPALTVVRDAHCYADYIVVFGECVVTRAWRRSPGTRPVWPRYGPRQPLPTARMPGYVSARSIRNAPTPEPTPTTEQPARTSTALASPCRAARDPAH